MHNKIMKILHTVEFYHPSIGGMQEVVKQISENLVKKGHEVHVATSYIKERKSPVNNGVIIHEFKIKGKSAIKISGEVKKYQDFLIQNNFDIITNFAAQQWATDLCLPLLDKIKAKKVIVPTGFSGLFSKEFRTYFNDFHYYLEKYDHAIYLSNDYRDINYARDYNILKYSIVPNGASKEEFTKPINFNFRDDNNLPSNSKLIVNISSHSGAKGHRETIDIFQKAKLNNTTLVIIADPSYIFKGGCKKDCENTALRYNKAEERLKDGNKIIIKELNRDQTVATLKQADLFLFPSNIECSPIVLFESMAAGVPFLVTDVGNSKEIINWTKAGELMPTLINEDGFSYADINESAIILKQLMNDVERRTLLGQNGLKVWSKKYTWEKIAGDYENIYESLLSTKHNTKPTKQKSNIGVLLDPAIPELQIKKVLTEISKQQQKISSIFLKSELKTTKIDPSIKNRIHFYQNIDELKIKLDRQKVKFLSFFSISNQWHKNHLALLNNKINNSPLKNLLAVYSPSELAFNGNIRANNTDGIIAIGTEAFSPSNFLFDVNNLKEVYENIDGLFDPYELWHLLIKSNSKYTLDYIFEQTSISLDSKHNKKADEIYRIVKEINIISEFENTKNSVENKGSELVNNIIKNRDGLINFKYAEENLSVKSKSIILANHRNSLKIYILKRLILQLYWSLKTSIKDFSGLVIKIIKFIFAN